MQVRSVQELSWRMVWSTVRSSTSKLKAKLRRPKHRTWFLCGAVIRPCIDLLLSGVGSSAFVTWIWMDADQCSDKGFRTLLMGCRLAGWCCFTNALIKIHLGLRESDIQWGQSVSFLSVADDEQKHESRHPDLVMAFLCKVSWHTKIPCSVLHLASWIYL